MEKPIESALEDALAERHPAPGPAFYRRMERAPWVRRQRPARRIALAGLVAAALLAALALTNPTISAALRATLGLQRSQDDQIDQPAGGAELIVVEPDPAASEPAADPSIRAAAQAAGWPVAVPGAPPPGYAFHGATYDPASKQVIQSFIATKPLPGSDLTASSFVTLVESPSNGSVPLLIAPSTELAPLTIGGTPAASAVGAWDSIFEPDGSAAGGRMVWQWRNDLAIRNLFWQREGRYIAIISDDPAVGLPELIRMAESLE
ncbi:MAG TPA: hypothetical protein VGE07_28385 [Herpetosiphonaceae bacterium]